MVLRGVLNLIFIVLQIFNKHRYLSRIASQTLWITLYRLVAVYLGQEFVHKLSFVSKLYTFAGLYLVRPPVSLSHGFWETLKLFILILKKGVKTDLKNIKKLNFQPPPATFFRENILASYSMQIYRKMMSLFVAPKGGNQCRVNPGEWCSFVDRVFVD